MEIWDGNDDVLLEGCLRELHDRQSIWEHDAGVPLAGMFVAAVVEDVLAQNALGPAYAVDWLVRAAAIAPTSGRVPSLTASCQDEATTWLNDLYNAYRFEPPHGACAFCAARHTRQVAQAACSSPPVPAPDRTCATHVGGGYGTATMAEDGAGAGASEVADGPAPSTLTTRRVAEGAAPGPGDPPATHGATTGPTAGDGPTRVVPVAYHGTHPDAARRIRDEGFRLDVPESNARKFGSGVYFSESEKIARGWSSDVLGGGGRGKGPVIKVSIGGRIAELDEPALRSALPRGDFSGFPFIRNDEDTAELKELLALDHFGAGSALSAAGIFLKNRGYAAMYLKPWREIVVFDPSIIDILDIT
ncbi:hypothetical protein ACIQMR_33410 [Streptomyces sp. NPDC091376]|uniref:hypothetical protein n=1 Tax=Streptomyces sp. NPDC091376 TaxID=3365994 RepID=UPI003815D017